MEACIRAESKATQEILKRQNGKDIVLGERQEVSGLRYSLDLEIYELEAQRSVRD